MSLDKPVHDLRISSDKPQSFPYYEEQLRVFWNEVKHSSVYEEMVFHGISCSCCERIRNPVLQISNKKKKHGRKAEVARI
jgi:hypothetical protein